MGNSGDEEGHAQTVEDALENKAAREKEEQRLPQQIAIMEPILRFLQLLCENHNRDLQVCNSPYNLVLMLKLGSLIHLFLYKYKTEILRRIILQPLF